MDGQAELTQLDGWLNTKMVWMWTEPDVIHSSTDLTWPGVSTLIETNGYLLYY